MKDKLNFFKYLTIIFISFHINTQEVDISDFSNLTKEQINQAQEILNNKITPNIYENINDKNKNPEEEESLKDNENISIAPSTSNRFGYNFISTSPTSIVATGDLPLPTDYKISLGDTIGVVLSGSKEAIFDMTVQLDGSVFFPELGAIYVAGDTYGEIKSKFSNLINQSFIGVEINLSLKNLSAKKITIVGAVNNPGTYLVNPFTTISNALAYSGGVQSIGSLRNIKLIRSNGENFTFDLYEFLINGNRKRDITIESGDVIVIGPVGGIVEIEGMVKRPGAYEMLPNENLQDLLRFALGFSGAANLSKITLSKLNADNSTIDKLITDDINSNLKDIFSVYIYPYTNDTNFSALVSGAVKEPGYYSLEDNPSLGELINNLEFIDVYPWVAVLEQFDERNLIRSSILFNLNDPSTYSSIQLLPNSKIFFANLYSREFSVSSLSKGLINDYALTLNYKSSSFKIPVFGQYSLTSFIDLLGLDMENVDPKATYISPLDSLVINDDYKNMKFQAKKFHTISFRSPVRDLINVTISGAIDYPGTYTLNSNTTLEDLYKLVGKFKPQAFMDGIIFTRESVRERQIKSIEKSKNDLNQSLLIMSQKGQNVGDISIITALSEQIEPENLGRIAGDFKPSSINSINTILLDGDAVIVPKNPNTINVFGEVLNPIAFEYQKGIRVNESIRNAGGFNEYANKRKVYVIRANGLIETAGRNVFGKNVKLEPGDTIVVPRKIFTNNPGIDALLPVTQILSDIAFSAAALESLSNN